MEKEAVIEINYQDILYIASGTDKDGSPLSGGTIAIDEIISDDETKTLENAPLDCVFAIHCEGGAVVLQCDFSGNQVHEQSKVLKICQNYIDRKNAEPTNNEVLNVVVVPLQLQGIITLFFQGLTYYTGVDLGNVKRVILVFDNLLTQVFQNPDVDIKEIQASVEAELSRQKAEIEHQIYEAQEELKKYNRDNPFEDMIQEQYSGSDALKDKDMQKQGEHKERQHKGRGEDSWED